MSCRAWFGFVMVLGSFEYGCSEYGFSAGGKELGADEEPGPGTTSDSGNAGLDDTGEGTGDPPDGIPDDPSEPPGDGPPEEWKDDCEDGVEAVFDSDEIYVLSWDVTEASGPLIAPMSAWYHVYTTSIMESGTTQWNESAYFHVSNATMPEGLPIWGNCGDDWVVADLDNYGSPGSSRVYVGTFWLDEGENTLTMLHYCPIYRSGECSSFHNAEDPDTTCDTTNVNSVHFDGGGACVVLAG